ncbi:MAG: HAD hydrolase-like protein [Oscillospiraceae bacterium]|nr:HAD hydrolase-like protein [Oscillospiraceae bacterium]
MRYTVALFDMDGTINKTDPGVRNGFRYAFSKLGKSFTEGVECNEFLGPSIEHSFEFVFGLEPELIPEAVKLYREYYSSTGINECELYPGLRELLARLKNEGVTLLTASSKPEKFVRIILDNFDIAKYFDYAAGGRPELGLSDKIDVIEHALAEAGVTDRTRCLMIGDRKYDIEGGRMAKIDTCGILWGYGDRPELEEAGADWIAATPEEVGDIICS